MIRPRVTWNGFVYYGEVIGFVLAWVIVVTIGSRLVAPEAAGPAIDQIASAESAMEAGGGELER